MMDEKLEAEFDPGAKNQEMNKRIFVNKYGVEIDLPSYYVLDAKIYPVNIDYCIKVVKHSLPNPDQVVKYYKSGEVPEDKTIGELYSEGKYDKENVVLQLIKI